ncbi:hypothetical protein FHL15_000256 [Xylaria flabelliformis]|uniref:Uncharacterized protein n=1 Tax=Xylaria flabelliformis TaxID=2512241 RepID=A0A553IFE3_9PEZI|nr:hypothetical protein FHL15_000256 [Xylaria flabelliformis]
MWNLKHVRRRETPSGVGDPMDGVEYSTLSQPSSGPQQQEADRYSGNPHSHDHDPEEGWEEFLELDIDNPPVRAGGNATTIGFEFELLVAVARAQEGFPDPHPTDHRWLSDRLINEDEGAMSYKYTVRNKIIDQLNLSGVVAHKIEEDWFTESTEDFQYWDSLEYESSNRNDIVLNWVGSYQWNGSETNDNNVKEAVRVLREQFIQYHKDNNIELYMTTQAVIKSVRDNISSMIAGESTITGRRSIVELWYDSVSLLFRDEKKKHHSATSASCDYRDPNSVLLEGADPRYYAWSCTDDVSIQDPFPTYEDYIVPIGSVPLLPNSKDAYANPPHLYKWYPAEVVSSILDYDNPSTRETLKTACKTLRDELRIHKPAAAVHTGVHIHIGQQAGWTLLHLKKFATLWHLIEPDLYKLHRRDRGRSIWCSPMGSQCNLARCVFGWDGDARYQATTTGPLRRVYQAQMQTWVPFINGHSKLVEYFTNIWQYSTIGQLNAAMGSGRRSETCVRWRIIGKSLSLKAGSMIQTLEFRLMQGTLDAEHIWKWASIVERLVIFARDSTAEAFRETLQHLLDGNYPSLIGLNQADIAWFESRLRDGYFAYPEPDDKVNWADPFMIRGYGDTHDDALNL